MSKENTFYFSHDYNTRNDIKIQRLISKKGYLGYGLFWALIENLYINANALPLDYDVIAFDLRTDSDTIKSIVEDFELFTINGSYFGSDSVQRRLDERSKKSEKARESALNRWNKSESNANALQPQSDSNAIKESKVNESKVKENKENKENIYRSFDHLSITIDEFNKLIEKNYSKAQIDRVLDSIENYKKNKQYKSLYLTACNWLSKETPEREVKPKSKIVIAL